MIIIRKAKITDAVDLYRLNEEFNGTDESTISNIEYSLSNNPNEVVLIAFKNEKAIGFVCAQVYSSICYTNKTAQITELYVNKEYRRQNVATMLMRDMELQLRALNAKNVFLQTSNKNINAQNLYEKLGYKRDFDHTYEKKL